MSLGLVPIVVNYGGPGEIVSGDTGFRLPLSSRERLIEHASTLLGEIASGEHDLAQLARHGLERVRSLYTWNRKALQLRDVYDWATGLRPAKPEFAFIDANATSN
jgi:glycosyltransferase involved in cell wall biosynthesis